MLTKWVCVSCRVAGSSSYQTIGKVYTVKSEVEYGDLEIRSFVGDDGVDYLFFVHDEDFVTLDEWREMQLNILI